MDELSKEIDASTHGWQQTRECRKWVEAKGYTRIIIFEIVHVKYTSQKF